MQGRGEEPDSLDLWLASAFPGRPVDGPAARAGQVVGDFQLVRRLGHGGMGEVWTAEQLSLGRRPVAVKFVRPERVTERHLQLFAREARAGGRLSHPGIVTVLVHGESDGLAWIAMELVPGGRTLRDLIDQMRTAPEVPPSYDREVARLVAEVATAMQVAHDAGILHRDLKPRNILLTPDGHAKVTDFGMAQITDETALTAPGELAGGTTHYMSPELLRGERFGIDHRADVFALGVVLYELLALQRPFQGDTDSQIAAQILLKDPPDPRTVRSRAARDLAVISIKALEKPVGRRYQSMAELAADLRRFLAHEPILATPPSRAYRAAKWIRRNPGKSSAAAIVAVTFTVIAILLAANVRTNRALSRSNVALEAKTVESEQRRVAAQQSADSEKAAGAIARAKEQEAIAARDDVLRLSALQKLEDLTTEADRLWPAHPENITPFEAWLTRAEVLVAELPGHEKRLGELRSKAAPWTAEEQAKHRAEHPKLAELGRAQRELEYSTRLRSVLESGAQGAEPMPADVGVDLSSLPASAGDVDSLAWPLIDPERTDFGDEQKGLVLERRAVQLASALSPAERAWIRDSLAWALFANGRFDEAVAEEEQALEEAGPDDKKDFEGRVARLRKAIDAAIDPKQETQRDKHRTELEARVAALETETLEPPEWVFADSQDKWWHNQLEKLVKGLRAFADEQTGLFSEGTSVEHGWGMKKRLASALLLRAGFAPDGEQARSWGAVLPEIRSAYPGLALTPQLGLVPLGPDPASGLWEFAHLETGEPAVRGQDGKLLLTEETGLVFVLLPGGTFPMGSQAIEPTGPNYDRQARDDANPVHQVTLSPFFLSKYEMTQGQWQRFAGVNPSFYGPDGDLVMSLLHPVEQVTWTKFMDVIDRLGLSLPSEAQWEYGARARTTTVWWTGDERETLRGAANLADQAAARAHAYWHDIEDWPELDDGYPVHGPVNTFAPNAFGLHNVHGNVGEWCLDGYFFGFYKQPATTDPVAPVEGSSSRVFRGGSFYYAAEFARSGHRGSGAPDDPSLALGLRPARPLAQ